MKEVTIVTIFATIAVALTGCALFKTPENITAGVYINNQKDSRATINSGNSNSQIIPINDKLTINQPPEAEVDGGEQVANATTAERKANAGGVFVNANVGDRSAATDITSAVDLLNNVRGTTAGQTQTTSKGDESPTTGSQSQQATQTEEKPSTVNIPISVGQAAKSDTGGAGGAGASAGETGKE